MTDILDEVKADLFITWVDQNTDQRVINLIKRAEYKINDYAGTQVDISKDLDARDLLINLVRYMYNNVTEQFETNFKSDILMLRARYKVAAMKNEEKDSETKVRSIQQWFCRNISNRKCFKKRF